MSYAVIRHYRANTALADVIVQNQEEIEEAFDDINGFENYYLIKTADSCISVTVCKNEDGCKESSTIAKNWLVKNAAEAVKEDPEVIIGEVIVDF